MTFLVNHVETKLRRQTPKAAWAYRQGLAKRMSAGDEVAYAWAMIRMAAAAVMVRMPEDGHANLCAILNDVAQRAATMAPAPVQREPN